MCHVPVIEILWPCMVILLVILALERLRGKDPESQASWAAY